MKKLQVLGPFHSGTNLLLKMLIDNCEDLDNPDDNKVDISENLLSWKHTLRIWYIDGLLQEKKENVLVLIYKNMYNWMMSMALDPIDVKLEKGLSGKCKMLNLEFENIIQMYNRYYRMYKFFLEKHPRQVVVLHYYKMIQKDTGPSYIRSKLESIGVQLVSEEMILEKLGCASRRESVANSSEAVDKYSLVQQTMQKSMASYPRLKSFIEQDLIDYFEEL